MAYHQLRISKIVQETPDARSFVLEIPADLADKYRYRAGQFLTFRVTHPDGAFNRCYSLSSAPETDGLPKVTAQLDADMCPSCPAWSVWRSSQ